MKKSLITGAAMLAVAGAASAQSSVTLSGVIDAQLQRIENSGTSSVNRVQSGGLGASRLNIAGREDLGDGLFASFVLEGQINVDNGTGAASNTNNQTNGVTPAGGLTFNRRSTVSLTSRHWGEIRLGREIALQSVNLQVYDPFSNAGVGMTQPFLGLITGAAAYRTSNTMHYALPNRFGGFFGDVVAYLGENPSNSVVAGVPNDDDGNGAAMRLGYRAGNVDLAMSYGRTQYATGNAVQRNIGGMWDLKVARLQGVMVRDEIGTTDARGWMLGTIIPVTSAGTIKLSVSQYNVQPAVGTERKSRKLSVGYVHAFSKRTAIYTTLAKVSNSGGAASAIIMGGPAPAANRSSRGVEAGIRHAF